MKVSVNEEALTKPVETFTLAINNLTTNSATLDISWENSYVSLKFEVPTNKLAIASIDKTLAGPTPEQFYTAAQYYYQSNGDIAKGRSYIDKAVEMSKNVPFYYLRLKSLIQAKQGDKKGAIESALEHAKEAHKNQDIYALDAAIENLNNAWQAASQDMYNAGGAAGNAGGADQGNTSGSDNSGEAQDVEYEEVK